MISRILSPCERFDLLVETGNPGATVIHRATGVVVAEGTADRRTAIRPGWQTHNDAIQRALDPWRRRLEIR